MDPDETLRQIRWFIEYLNDPHEIDHERTVAWDLAAVVDDLDQWLSAGGFLPAAWAERGSRCK